MHKNAELYYQDFDAWINSQISLLRQGRGQELNQEFLAEELEDMSRRQRRELVNRLVILIAHLLKWQYQPGHRSSSWRGTIFEQRDQVGNEILLSPSLKSFVDDAIEAAYPRALHLASKETGINKNTFPEQCPYQAQELLDEDYWPN
ncbi:hypothetical protein TI04_10535 [Achromatium sp. WMS2]|nr:hypothetical protein TI04_10535 [Achromatium sp. WMS2]